MCLLRWAMRLEHCKGAFFNSHTMPVDRIKAKILALPVKICKIII